MNSQPTRQLPPSKSHNAVLPESYGVAIPSNPHELLLFIQRQQRRGTNRVNKDTDDLGRAQKQEQQRELYENKLMEFEDYVYRPEGTVRLRRRFEHMQMEAEDELSMALEMSGRKKGKQLDFKEHVRLEVEERLRQEELERETRRKAAEDRRAAVVERLRKKAEEEERRKQEAEAALLRIHEEAKRREQEAIDRLANDRSCMIMEDELSRLAEQDDREKQERLAWEKKEREKVAEFERTLRERDAAEAEARKERMAVLEEKKARLAELKRLQGISGAAAGGAQEAQQAARQEAAKLDKQMRIQNRAKFVTKKIKAGGNAEAEVVQVVDDLSALTAAPSEDAHGVRSSSGSNVNISFNAAATTVAVSPNQHGSDNDSAALEGFAAGIHSTDSESELRALQRDLMTEKRALRMEQKQRLSSQGKAAAQDPVDIERAKELRRRIAEVTQKEGIVQRRLQALLSATQTAVSGGAAGSAVDYAKTAKAAAESSAELNSLLEVHAEQPDSRGGGSGSGSGGGSLGKSDAERSSIYTRAEHILHEGHGLLKWLSEPGAFPVGTSAAGPNVEHSGPSVDVVRPDGPNLQRRATLVAVEAAQLAKEIDPLQDPGGYADNLTHLSKQLKGALLSPKPQSEEAPLPSELQEGSRDASGLAARSDTAANDATSAVCGLVESAADRDAAKNPRGPAAEGMQQAVVLENFIVQPHTVSPGADHTAEGPVLQHPLSEPTLGDEGEADEAAFVFEHLPGWQECLATSMASAAHHAAFHGYSEVLDCLCRYFDCFVMDKRGRTPLFYAALQNRLSCVASLVSLDPQWIDVGDENGDTALHAAAIANGVEVLEFLLQCEANPDTANYAGLTPCHLARTRTALEVLCSAGAMPYCVDAKSRMPLWFACSEGRNDCVEFLCTKTPAEYLLWPDEEGETCLHRAASSGHAQCVEVLAQQLPKTEDLYALNRKQHTPAHVASTAAVLKALFENGANLWTSDPKGRMPLFAASFFGRADCVAFLLDVAGSCVTPGRNAPETTETHVLVSWPDFQGDTPLHVACLCGHIRCVSLLLFFAQCSPNKQGLTPDQLATKGGHHQIAQLVAHVRGRRETAGLSPQQIYGCDYSVLSAVILYYGSRWSKLYDVSFDTVYYLDRATGQSQWERPESYDEPPSEEEAADRARQTLHRFYSQYNPSKLCSMNDILAAYKGRYAELFISLADKYNVQDLSMFKGVMLD